MFLASLIGLGSVYSKDAPQDNKVKIEVKVEKHRRKMPVRHRRRRVYPKRRVIMKKRPDHDNMDSRHSDR